MYSPFLWNRKNYLIMPQSRVLEVLDKGKAASVRTISETKDPGTGEIIFENVMTVFVRGSGGFSGKKTGNGDENLNDDVENPIAD